MERGPTQRGGSPTVRPRHKDTVIGPTACSLLAPAAREASRIARRRGSINSARAPVGAFWRALGVKKNRRMGRKSTTVLSVTERHPLRAPWTAVKVAGRVVRSVRCPL